MDDGTKRFALMIDAEIISPACIGQIMEKISELGIATYRRIYANWTIPDQRGWKDELLTHSIQPMQQFRYTTGKNATDSAMIIDAMDILYAGSVDGFVLVSSDSDFTRLASRLRESGMWVVGMGEEKTPKAFVNACNEFKYLEIPPSDVLPRAPSSSKDDGFRQLQASNTSRTPVPQIRESIDRIIDAESDDDGWVALSLVGIRLRNQYPDFDHRHYGCQKMTQFIEKLGYEMESRRDANNIMNPTGVLVYIKKKNRAGLSRLVC